MERALATLLERLDAWLAARPEEAIAAWRERDALIGEPIRWNGGAGTAAGIDDKGSLLVDLDGGDGRTALDAGEVHLLR